MKNKRRNWVLAGLFLLSFLILFISGCDKYTRHEVLTFFFTGVPLLEEDKKAEAGEKKTAEVQLAKNKKKRRKIIRKSKFFVHGPSAAGQCYQCHDTSGTFAFRKTGKKEVGDIPRLGELSGRLVAPLEDICTECHIQKLARSANSKDFWLHGPVAGGNCTFCHSPHQSPFQYMLLKEKSIELCTQCHVKGYVLEIEEHKKDKECISCHNPHIGKSRFLLKKDFNEMF